MRHAQRVLLLVALRCTPTLSDTRAGSGSTHRPGFSGWMRRRCVPLQLTKSVTGYDLTFAADIQAAANAGLVVLLDTGAVFIGTVGPSS